MFNNRLSGVILVLIKHRMSTVVDISVPGDKINKELYGVIYMYIIYGAEIAAGKNYN